MREAVKLPEGEDLNEWLALNVFDFYNTLSMLYGMISEDCTKKTCPKMTAGPDFVYRWRDDQKFTNPVDLPACEYIGYLMDWVNAQLEDEQIFPSSLHALFPKNFQSIVKNIMRRLFRIYAHCYNHHIDTITRCEALAHWNTSFKQFLFFSNEFNMIPQKELAPLKEIVDSIMKS